MKRRYNYLSHMVDSATDSVSRIAKISAFWATMSQGILVINLVLYIGAEVISPITVVLFSFLLWSAIFGVMIITQLGWIAHIVFSGTDEDDYPKADSPYPTPFTTTKHYVFDGKQYKIDKVVERVGGEQEDLQKDSE